MSQPVGSLEVLVSAILTLNTNIETLIKVIGSGVAVPAAAAAAPADTKAEDTKPEVDEKAEKAKAEKAEKAAADKAAKEAKAKADKEAKAEKEAKSSQEKTKLTKTDITESLRKVRADIDKDEAVRIIKEVGGVEKMGQIPEDKYEDVFNACEAALNGGSQEEESEDEDM